MSVDYFKIFFFKDLKILKNLESDYNNVSMKDFKTHQTYHLQ